LKDACDLMDANACLTLSGLVSVGKVSMIIPGLVVWRFDRTEFRFSGPGEEGYG
jgi:hypothetical protein